MQKDYPPLQEEILSLLCNVSEVLTSKFSAYYGNFMPKLKNILANTPSETKK
jgi:hypothetical protein